MKENPEKYAKVINEYQVYKGVPPDIGLGPTKIKNLFKGGKTLINFIKQWAKGGPKKVKVSPPTTPHYGSIKSLKDVDNIVDITKNKGKLFDEAYSKKPWNWSSANFEKLPSVDGREMVKLNIKGLPSLLVEDF